MVRTLQQLKKDFGNKLQVKRSGREQIAFINAIIGGKLRRVQTFEIDVRGNVIRQRTFSFSRQGKKTGQTITDFRTGRVRERLPQEVSVVKTTTQAIIAKKKTLEQLKKEREIKQKEADRKALEFRRAVRAVTREPSTEKQRLIKQIKAEIPPSVVKQFNQRQTTTDEIKNVLSVEKKERGLTGVTFDLRGFEKVKRAFKGEVLILTPLGFTVRKRDGKTRPLTEKELLEIAPKSSISLNPANFVTGFFGLAKDTATFITTPNRTKRVIKGVTEVLGDPDKAVGSIVTQAISNPFGFAGELSAIGRIQKAVVLPFKAVKKIKFKQKNTLTSQIKNLENKGVKVRDRTAQGSNLRNLKEQKKIVDADLLDLNKAINEAVKPVTNNKQLKKKIEVISDLGSKIRTRKKKRKVFKLKQETISKGIKELTKKPTVKIQVKITPVRKLNIPTNPQKLITFIENQFTLLSTKQFKILKNRLRQDKRITFKLINGRIKNIRDLSKITPIAPTRKIIKGNILFTIGTPPISIFLKQFLNPKVLSAYIREIKKGIKESQLTKSDIDEIIFGKKQTPKELLQFRISKFDKRINELKQTISTLKGKAQTLGKTPKEKVAKKQLERFISQSLIEVKKLIGQKQALLRRNNDINKIQTEYTTSKNAFAKSKRGSVPFPSFGKVVERAKNRTPRLGRDIKIVRDKFNKDVNTDPFLRKANRFFNDLVKQERRIKSLDKRKDLTKAQKQGVKTELKKTNTLKTELALAMELRILNLFGRIFRFALVSERILAFKPLFKTQLSNIAVNINKIVTPLKKAPKIPKTPPKTPRRPKPPSPPRRTKTPKRPPKTPRAPKRPRPPKKPPKVLRLRIPNFLKLPKKGLRAGFIVRIKEGNRIISETSQLLPRKRAINLMRERLDNTPQASGEIVRKTKTSIVDVKKTILSNKFRAKRSKDPKVRIQVEKRKFRLDSKGEQRGLSRKKTGKSIGRRKKSSKNRSKSVKRKSKR